MKIRFIGFYLIILLCVSVSLIDSKSIYNYDGCDKSPIEVTLVSGTDVTTKTLSYGYYAELDKAAFTVYLPTIGKKISITSEDLVGFIGKNNGDYFLVAVPSYTWCQVDSCNPCQEICYQSGSSFWQLRTPDKTCDVARSVPFTQSSVYDFRSCDRSNTQDS